MKNVPIEILVFERDGKKVEDRFRNLFQSQLLDQMRSNYGEELAVKVKSAFSAMKRMESDMIQMRHGDRRVRVRLAA